MTPRPILTAAETRAAEEALFAAGTDVHTLMERAGAAVAEAAWRFAGPVPTLILCGPGNNGGDGYVAARRLGELGVPVRVAAIAEPRTDAARAARARWGGAVEPLAQAKPATLLIDCLFGTGLARGLDDRLADDLLRLAAAARLTVAVDVPSGVASDDGAILSPVPAFDATVALGVLKPAHRLQPAAADCGRVIVADIGLNASAARLREIARPHLPAPGPDDHKYTRGYVSVIAGEMHGAAALAATAAARAGAGYVALVGDVGHVRTPDSIVRVSVANPDPRTSAIVVGPGLGRSEDVRARLVAARDAGRPMVLDGDALHWLGPDPAGLDGHILTPHAGEFARLFPRLSGSKLDRARAAAAASGGTIVFKGADTVVASPDGRAAIAPPASAWLATAGTGDVLAGIAGAMLARGLAPFDAACAAVWLHGDAARRAGPGLIADDLAGHLAASLADCR